MGMICPECKIHRAQKRVLNADLQSPRTSEDVFIIELECGHTVGAERAKKFIEATTSIKARYASQKTDLEKALSKELADAWEVARK